MYDINDKMAYFFGFFWGDGGMKSNNKPTIPKICIAKDDGQQLYSLFQECFEFSYVEYAQLNRKIRSTFYFKNKELKSFLLEMGGMNKSYLAPTKILKVIPEDLHRYFWRGLIDADGCFCKRKDRKGGSFSITSTIAQDWSEAEKLFSSLGIENSRIFRKKYKNGNSSTIEIKYGPDLLRLGNYIYNENFDGIGLKRKFDKFNLIKESLPKRSSQFKGVSFHNGFGRWRVYVKRKFIGWFLTEREAYEARAKFLNQKSVSERY
jgi:hypothetical protein